MPISAADVKIVLSAQDNASPAVKQFGVNAEKALRDVEGATGKLNGVFEKFKQNWLGLAAAAYAAKEAFQKAWDMAGVAADYNERIAALNALGAQYGMTGTQIVNATKEASRGLISLANAADMAAIGMNLALSPQQVAEFTSVAEALSDVIGGSIPEAYDRMVVAAASGRTTTLAQMGILVDLDKAYKDHAEAIGRKAESLTSLEKQQIRVNTILETAKGKVADLGGGVDSTRDKMDRLVMTLQDIELWLGQATIKGAAMALSGFQYLAAGVLGLVSAYSRYRALVYDAIGDEKKHQENLINANAAWEARNALLKDAANNWQLATTNSTTIASFRRTGNLPVDYGAPAGSGKTSKTTKSDIMTQAEKDAILVKDELERVQKVWEDNEEWLKTHVWDEALGDYVDIKEMEEQAKEAERIAKARLDAERDIYEDLRGYAGEYYEATKRMIETQAEAYRKLGIDEVAIAKWVAEELRKANLKKAQASGSFSEGWKAGLEEMQQDLMTWGKAGYETFRSFYENARSTMSDVLFDGIKGDMKSFSEYWKSFSDALLRKFTDIIAQMVVEWALGMTKMASLKSAGSGLSSIVAGVVSTVGSVFGSGGQSGFQGSYSMMHTGGMATEPGFYRIGINPRIFDSAPRYHGGIGPNETAAILRKDEGVFTPGQMRALGLMAGRGATTINVPINMDGQSDKRLASNLRRAIEDTVRRELQRNL